MALVLTGHQRDDQIPLIEHQGASAAFEDVDSEDDLHPARWDTEERLTSSTGQRMAIETTGESSSIERQNQAMFTRSSSFRSGVN